MGSGSSRGNKTGPAGQKGAAAAGKNRPNGQGTQDGTPAGANGPNGSNGPKGGPGGPTSGSGGVPYDDRNRDQPRGERRAPPYNRDNTRDNPRDDGRRTPRPTSAYLPGGPQGSRRQGPADPRSKAFEERAKLMDELDRIAQQAIDNPPGAIYNSKSYDASYDYYNTRVNSNSQEELESWLDMELDTLKHHVVDDLLKAHYSMDDLRSVQDSPQLYEYRLQLAALVHVFDRENNDWERFNLQMENERQQDLEFLRSMQDRVERGTQRPVVLDTMSEYANRNTGGNGYDGRSGNVYPAAGGIRRTRTQFGGSDPNPPRRYGQQQDGAGSRGFSDEAGRIISEYERNRQKAVETRKQDRDRIDRQLQRYRQN